MALPPPPSLPSTLRDPKSLFFQQDGIRRAIIASYWALIILALPLWWYTTSIERLSLPSTRIQQLAHNHLELPIKICLETREGTLVEQVKSQLLAGKSQDPLRWKGLAPEVIGSADCGKYAESGAYIVKFKSGTPMSINDRELHIPSSSEYTSALANTLTSLIAPYSASSDPDNRVVQYSPHYRLAFSLLNEDAAAGDAVLGWNIQAAIRKYINPITQRLSALHNFTVESQVQFHAPLAFLPRQLDDVYGIEPADLTVFVNSAEWTLSSSSSNDPVLHFILFIPSSQRRPLRILLNDGKSRDSTAFLLPQWGGIVIHNPPTPTDAALPSQALHIVFSSFANQLSSLLGIPVLPNNIDQHSDAGVSDWQLDALTRRRTLENAEGSRDTLLSIVKLVNQIENMPVGPDVRDDVEGALSAFHTMSESASSSLAQAFAYSAQSFVLASRAFFSPGMLALLYFPAEHTYAVYSPLFASALIPLLVAALREYLAWKRERKEKLEREREKRE
ncbi:hypothetical protein BDN70DRAFT_796635 [Pholiota conissans]|uniref:GPI transamidase component PIG-S n=1 Tax=Pholiota conissans TaxID=109636 RepID=A0A9P5ZDB3_9AGAR|nr:hypothetical protein BDN70DRAFT_796635 [Pholiota conissans]